MSDTPQVAAVEAPEAGASPSENAPGALGTPPSQSGAGAGGAADAGPKYLTPEQATELVQAELAKARAEWESQTLARQQEPEPPKQSAGSEFDRLVARELGDGASDAQIRAASEAYVQIRAWEREKAAATTIADRNKAQSHIDAYANRLATVRRDVQWDQFQREQHRKPEPVDPDRAYRGALAEANTEGFQAQLAHAYPALAAQVKAGTIKLDDVLRGVDWSRAADTEAHQRALVARFEEYERHASHYGNHAATLPPAAPPAGSTVGAAPAPINPGAGAPGESEGYAGKSNKVLTMDEYNKKLDQGVAARVAARQGQ